MYKIVVALRYLRVRLLTAFSILFVTLGVGGLIVINAVMTGFQKEFKERVRGTLSHLTVRLDDPEQYDKVAATVAKHPDVVAVAPRKEGLVLLAYHDEVIPCTILGVDPPRQFEVGELASYLLTSSKMLREDMLRTFERRDGHPKWIYDRHQDLGEGRLRVSLRYEWVVTGETKWPQRSRRWVVVLDKKQRIIELQTYDAGGRSGPPPAEAPAELRPWFARANEALAKRNIEGVMALVHDKMRISHRYLEPERPFQLNGGAIPQDAPGLVVGFELFRQLGLRLGDHVELITAKVTTSKDKQGRLQKDVVKEGKLFTVTGMFKTGMNEYDSNFLYAPYEEMVEFLDRKRGSYVAARLKDHDRSAEIKLDLMNNDGLIGVSTWQDKRRNLLRAVDMERAVINAIMFVVIIFAVVVIVVILVLLVFEKTRDIGILKSMGATSWGICAIFVANGMVVGLIGCLLGTIAGVALALNVNEVADWIYLMTGFRVFPRDVYYLDRIPSEVEPIFIAWAIVIALILCLIGCLLPSIRAARLEVVDTLKWE